MFENLGINIGYFIVTSIVLYLAYTLKPENEKDITVVYLDNNGKIINIDPPYTFNISNLIDLETGYRLDSCLCKRNMLFFLLKPITHKYKRSMKGKSIIRLISVSSCNSTLKVKECY